MLHINYHLQLVQPCLCTQDLQTCSLDHAHPRENILRRLPFHDVACTTTGRFRILVISAHIVFAGPYLKKYDSIIYGEQIYFFMKLTREKMSELISWNINS